MKINSFDQREKKLCNNFMESQKCVLTTHMHIHDAISSYNFWTGELKIKINDFERFVLDRIVYNMIKLLYTQ